MTTNGNVTNLAILGSNLIPSTINQSIDAEKIKPIVAIAKNIIKRLNTLSLTLKVIFLFKKKLTKDPKKYPSRFAPWYHNPNDSAV